MFFKQLLHRKAFEKADATKIKVFDRTKFKQTKKKFEYRKELNKSVNTRLYDSSKLSIRRKPYERVTSVNQSFVARRRSVVTKVDEENQVIFDIEIKDPIKSKTDNNMNRNSDMLLLDLEGRQWKEKTKRSMPGNKKHTEIHSSFYSLDFISPKQWVVYM